MEPEDEKTANAVRLNVPPDATRPRGLGDRLNDRSWQAQLLTKQTVRKKVCSAVQSGPAILHN
jgi:hypothetical protein